MRIQRSIDVNASADDAWKLLADDFGNEAAWTTAIDGSYLVGDRFDVGAERHCQISGPLGGDGLTVERVTAIDRDAMSYSYEAVSGLPSFMKSARNTLSVTPLAGHRCRIHADAHIALPWWLTPLGPLVSLGAGSAVRKFFRDLQFRLENGAPRTEVAADGRRHR